MVEPLQALDLGRRPSRRHPRSIGVGVVNHRVPTGGTKSTARSRQEVAQANAQISIRRGWQTLVEEAGSCGGKEAEEELISRREIASKPMTS